MTKTETTGLHPDVRERFIRKLEAFYPNTGDQVIEWRREGARNIFDEIYELGVNDGEVFAYAKRNIKI